MTFTTDFTTSQTKGWTKSFSVENDDLPLTIPNLSFWYDAADAGTITKDGSNLVSQWNDKSGNRNHATQGTGTKQPTYTLNQQNTLPTLVFDGGDTLVMPSGVYAFANGNQTLFCVAKRNTEAGTVNRLMSMNSGGAANFRLILGYSSVAASIQYGCNGTGTVASKSGATNTNYQIIQGGLSSTTQSVTFNNNTKGTGTGAAQTVDSAYIGSNTDTDRYLTGGIGEIIAYARALDATEELTINRYLATKWGITLA